MCCYWLQAPSVGAPLLPVVTGDFACPCHLCLCAQSSWRWHDSPRLCVPLQGAKSFCVSFQGRCSCILVTQHYAVEAVLNRRFLKVLVGYFCLEIRHQKQGIITEKRWKDCLILNEHPPFYCVYYSHDKCFLLAIWLAPFSCQYQYNTSDSGCVRHKRFCFTHPIIRTKMNSKTIIHYKVLWPKIISLAGLSENNMRFLTNLKCQARLCIFSVIKGQLVQNSFASNFICNLDHCWDTPLGRNLDAVKSG